MVDNYSIEELTVKLGKSSQRAALTSFLSVLIVVGAMIYSAIQLNVLEQQRNQIRAELGVLEQQKTTLLADIENAKNTLSSRTKALMNIQNAVKEVGVTNPGLAKEVADRVVRTDNTVAQIIPLVYLQIGEESQRETARRIVTTLQNQGYTVPGIENVGIAKLPETFQVRYFQTQAETDGRQIVNILRRLTGNEINWQLTYVRGYETVLPGQYEIWFGRRR